jgi:hypothetical protein
MHESKKAKKTHAAALPLIPAQPHRLASGIAMAHVS